MKKILFITGTRADYGKLKSVMKKLQSSKEFDIYIYVTGMHLIEKYGNTYKEIEKDNFNNIFLSKPISNKKNMSEILANNILQLSNYIKNNRPDMIFIHGDRVEALAGAIVGALNNIYVSHIEGGEISGTIDESIRHSISKFSNFHFVSNNAAKKVLVQMGERKDDIFVVGSPDIDIMLNNDYDINEIKKMYDICFDKYGILIFHPVTTEVEFLNNHVKTLVDAIINSNKKMIVIYPNNDHGTEKILKEYKRFEEKENIKLFPSIRFEYFLTLLKHAEFVIGNSSLGIRETGVYGIPTINVGSRQSGRYNTKIQKNICCVENNYNEIQNAINNIDKYKYKINYFGNGNSDELIYMILKDNKLWERKLQKKFITIF